MKCKLTKDGELIITSESDLEEYGLTRWIDANDLHNISINVVN